MTGRDQTLSDSQGEGGDGRDVDRLYIKGLRSIELGSRGTLLSTEELV